jgi:hypothetical protein
MAAGAEGTSSVSSYRVGDVTRGILAMGRITRGSEDKSYKFGDFTRGLLAPSSGAAMRKLKAEAADQSAVQILESAADRGIFEDRLQMMGEEPAHIVQAQPVPAPPVPPISEAGRQLYAEAISNKR